MQTKKFVWYPWINRHLFSGKLITSSQHHKIMSRISPKDLRMNSMTQWQVNRAEKWNYWADQIRRWQESGLMQILSENALVNY